MGNNWRKILTVAKVEQTTIIRYRWGSFFSLVFIFIFVYSFVSQVKVFPIEYIKFSPVVVSFVVFLIYGVIAISARFHQQQKDYSLESLLTTPLTVSQIIFGKTLGIISISSIYAVIANILFVITLVIKLEVFYWEFFYTVPLSICVWFIFYFCYLNLSLMLQFLWRETEVSKITFFGFVGLGFLIFTFIDDYLHKMIILSFIFVCLLLFLIVIQFVVFNLFIKKHYINRY